MRTIKEIAQEIQSDWKNVNYAARPYLEVMHKLNTIEDKFMNDYGSTIVVYFLSNAGSYRGETAKRIKNELKTILKS